MIQRGAEESASSCRMAFPSCIFVKKPSEKLFEATVIANLVLILKKTK